MSGPRYSGASQQFVVSLGSLDEPKYTVHAQYRPKELEVTQSVPWAKHNSKNSQGALQLEFSGAEGRQTSLELFLDESEIQNGSVAQRIETLTKLAAVRSENKDERDDEMKRPHHCVLVFGNVYGQKPFQCVIESISTKYTMFSPDGAPIRATVNVKLKETRFKAKEMASWAQERAKRDAEGQKQDAAREAERLRIFEEKKAKAEAARRAEIEEERAAAERKRAR